MTSKDNKDKYVDGAKEEAPPKKQRMIGVNNSDDDSSSFSLCMWLAIYQMVCF
jgi:hypothetical protein